MEGSLCKGCPVVRSTAAVINLGPAALGVPIGGCGVVYRLSGVSLVNPAEDSCGFDRELDDFNAGGSVCIAAGPVRPTGIGAGSTGRW